MNSMQVKDKLKNIAVKRNLDFNTLLRLYMYDRFIERLAVSKYRWILFKNIIWIRESIY